MTAASSKRDDRADDEAKSLPDDARLLDVPTICLAGRASLRTVRYWIASGQLRVTKIGRSVRVRMSDWLAFLDARAR